MASVLRSMTPFHQPLDTPSGPGTDSTRLCAQVVALMPEEHHKLAASIRKAVKRAKSLKSRRRWDVTPWLRQPWPVVAVLG